MCLSTIDKKVKKHKYGYKRFERFSDTSFGSPIYTRGVYLLGHSYNALKCSPYTDKLPKIVAANNQHYRAGFHYFLKLKDAATFCNSSEVIVRVIVKNIIVTGTDLTSPCGVCEDITLDKVVFEKKKFFIDKEIEGLINCCTGPIEAIKSYHKNPNDQDLDQFKRYAKNFSLLWKLVTIIGAAPRSSEFFKTGTRMWVIITKDWHPKIKSNYDKLTSIFNDRYIHPRIKQKMTKIDGYKYDADKLILGLTK